MRPALPRGLPTTTSPHALVDALETTDDVTTVAIRVECGNG